MKRWNIDLEVKNPANDLIIPEYPNNEAMFTNTKVSEELVLSAIKELHSELVEYILLVMNHLNVYAS